MRDDVAGVVPAVLRALQHAGIFGAQIAEHHVGAAHEQAPALLDAGHRVEPRLHAGQQPADRAEPVEHRRVERERRRRLGDAIAFQDAQPELLHIDAAGRLLHRLGAGQHVAQRAEVVGVRRARIARQERIGAEQDGGVGAVDHLRNDPVVQRGGVEVDADARNQRQDEADREPERMEQRQHVEHLVGAAEVDARFRLRRIGEHVAVGQDDALRACLRIPT